MSASYSIEPISSKLADRTYVLMKQIVPALTMREWREFCGNTSTSHVGGERSDGCEQVRLAVNSQGYIKGLCVYAIRDHWNYGRLVDVPFFFVASAADAKGVARELQQFLLTTCGISVCSGLRFWKVSPETWGRRLNNELVSRADHGIFMPAIPGVAKVDGTPSASMLANAAFTDQFSQ